MKVAIWLMGFVSVLSLGTACENAYDLHKDIEASGGQPAAPHPTPVAGTTGEAGCAGEAGNGSSEETTCMPGKTVSCTCAQGGKGRHTCTADGSSHGLCVQCVSTSEQQCTPGAWDPCACTNGQSGWQQCAEDGESYATACGFCGAQAPGTTGDTDGDGWVEGFDNCPSIWNPLQKDLDDDGVGDACDSDVDGDGVTTDDGDCNDRNASVHPGAIERCDGLNNDCDGSTDEQCSGEPADEDQDGASAEEDCNDQNTSVHPGANEVCGNQLDDDCSGMADDGCTPSQPSPGYVAIRYVFATPGGVTRKSVSIYQEVTNDAGKVLPRTDPYGPFGSTPYLSGFAWGIATDDAHGDTACYRASASSIGCVVHVPRSSVVHANVWSVSGGNDWACQTANGMVEGTFVVMDVATGKVIPYTTEAWPLPDGMCRFVFRAPA